MSGTEATSAVPGSATASRELLLLVFEGDTGEDSSAVPASEGSVAVAKLEGGVSGSGANGEGGTVTVEVECEAGCSWGSGSDTNSEDTGDASRSDWADEAEDLSRDDGHSENERAVCRREYSSDENEE